LGGADASLNDLWTYEFNQDASITNLFNTKQDNLTFKNFLTKEENEVTLGGTSTSEGVLSYIAPGFDISSGFNNGIYALALDSNNKIYVGGWFTTYGGLAQQCLIRLNSNGTKDASFDIGSGFRNGFNNIIHAIVLDSSGHIYVGGDFATYKGLPQQSLIRLNSDGSKDTTFDMGSGFNYGSIHAIALDSSGHIYVGGDFTSYNGLPQKCLIRLNPDGTKDTTFDIGTGFNTIVYKISLDSNNKIYVGGQFTTYKGLTQNRLIRLKPDGSKDATFDIGTGFNGKVQSIALDPSGYIYVGGSFTTYRGLTQNHLIRLNSDGSKDTAFDIGSGFNSYMVNSIVLDSSNKLYVGGDFTTYQGLPQNRLIRLNLDGTKDVSYDISVGFNDTINYLALYSNNKIYVGGWFITYKGLPQNRLVRLNPDGTNDNKDASTSITIDRYGLSYESDYSSLNTSNSRWIPDKAYADTKVAKVGDTMTGNLIMSGQRIQSIALPIDPSDAVNKFYVDSSITDLYLTKANNASLGLYVQKSGDVMTGPLTINAGGLQVQNDISIFGKTYINGNTYVGGDVAIQGNINIDGSMYISNVEQIDISAAYITLNTGLTGTPPLTLQSGIVVNRGSEPPYIFGYNELEQTFRIGVSYLETSTHFSDASTQAVATREDDPTPFGISYWNPSNYRFDTGDGFTFEPSVALNISINTTIDSSLFVDGNIGIKTMNPQYTLDVSGGVKIDGSLNMSNQRIHSLSIPADSSDAVNKFYVDSSFALKTDIESSLGLYVQKAGDTMTGPLTINSSFHALENVFIDGSTTLKGNLLFNPSNTWSIGTGGASGYPLHIWSGDLTAAIIYANEYWPRYSTTDINFHSFANHHINFIPGASGNIIMFSPLLMSNQLISSLHTPIDSSDAVNKFYVDSSFALKTEVNSSLGLYVQKAGDTMSGPLTINSSLFVFGAFSSTNEAPLIVQNTNAYASPYTQYSQVWLDSLGDAMSWMRNDGTFFMGGAQGQIRGKIFQAQGNGSAAFSVFSSTPGGAGIFFPNSGKDIGFASGGITSGLGVETLRIDSSHNVGINTTTPIYTLDISGNLHTSGSSFADGSLNMNNQRIQSLTLPIDPSDAVNKFYVDSSFALKTDILRSIEVSSNIILIPNTIAMVDTSISAISVTIPSTLTNGDTFDIIDAGYNSSTNNINISRNGHKINGKEEDFTLDINGSNVNLIYRSLKDDLVISNLETLQEYNAGGKTSKAQMTLFTASWDISTFIYTLSTLGIIYLDANDVVIIAPVDKTDSTYWANAGVFCTDQSLNTLYFSCDSIPDGNIKINIAVI
jgi:uncharacterized delta-60 repeat protein